MFFSKSEFLIWVLTTRRGEHDKEEIASTKDEFHLFFQNLGGRIH
jgi:hypothetical protein